MTEDATAERYAELGDVIRAAMQHEDFPTQDVGRLDVRLLANGKATWKAWTRSGDDTVGGVYRPD